MINDVLTRNLIDAAIYFIILTFCLLKNFDLMAGYSSNYPVHLI